VTAPNPRCLVALVLAASACQPIHEEQSEATSLTYWKDVHPILAARCHQCHLDGPSSYRPWFDSYEHVAEVAGSIAIAVAGRDMPPWAMTADGTCASWDRAHWLTDAEIRTLEAWADSDLAEGDVADAHSPDFIPAPRALRRVDAVVDTGVEYRPALGDRLHRCFRVRPALEPQRASQLSSSYLTALEVIPGNPRAVQHVSLYALDTSAAEAEAEALDAEDGEPGYHCFAGSRVDGARLLATWVWGDPAFRFPDGTGVRLDSERDVVVQIHYSASGGSATPAPDRTRIELELTAHADEGRFVAVEVPDLVLAPDRQLAIASAFVDVPESIVVHGVFPFMHSLGHTLSLLRAPGAECLAEVRHWHLYGHMSYHGYREPVRLEAGERLWLECGYDTRSRDRPVVAGDDLEGEACRVHLYATAPGGPLRGSRRQTVRSTARGIGRGYR
jgi:hypothetical protein